MAVQSPLLPAVAATGGEGERDQRDQANDGALHVYPSLPVWRASVITELRVWTPAFRLQKPLMASDGFTWSGSLDETDIQSLYAACQSLRFSGQARAARRRDQSRGHLRRWRAHRDRRRRHAAHRAVEPRNLPRGAEHSQPGGGAHRAARDGGVARHHQGVTAVGLGFGVPADLRHRPGAAGVQGGRVVPERPRRERAGQRGARAGGAGARVVVDRRHLPRAAQAAVHRGRDRGAAADAGERAAGGAAVRRVALDPDGYQDSRAAEAADGAGELRAAASACGGPTPPLGELAHGLDVPPSTARPGEERTSETQPLPPPSFARNAARGSSRARGTGASAARSIRWSCRSPIRGTTRP